jgi:hypothetical protein
MSRSNSVIISGTPTSLYPRARLPTMNASAIDASPFPISGHGVHSRRASENIAIRRQENIAVPPATDEVQSLYSATPKDTIMKSPIQQPSFWKSLVVVRTGDATCERGGWDATDMRVFGIRRKARSNGKGIGGTIPPRLNGLTSVTLERWELWTFDPSLPHLRSSSLAALLTLY